ncbi:probable LRR receptor-like serine/threonine-protein kinase At1g56140 isoform X2 [Cajanus cajan]|uniref:probable LRR receptor-like serine/threonine-protein kinase At1g56140 isoform X2 n=1 Tax=Cajanus cajan TaxID=3821 RepID=UPI0010FBA985|nr:probable LRR receptor-like serine/threonine-protein kinase At1g56140 isoform X2 [Cajanus cajan]
MEWCLLPPTLAFALVAVVCTFNCLVNATTDPNQARTLNAIFSKWGIKANPDHWNISGDLCSGRAIDDTLFADRTYNPFIKCDCFKDSENSTCHITKLKVYALSVVGEIPEELWTLTNLTELDIRQNHLTGSLPPAIGKLTRMEYLSFGINALSGEIPKELGNLIELKSLWANDVELTGRIPDFIGNWSNLNSL